MKRISLVGYFGTLVGCLALAYLTWVQGPKAPGARVTIFPCSKGDIVKLTYAAADRTVTFSKRKSRDSGGASWWVEVVRPSASAAAKGSDAAQGTSADEADAPEGSLPSGASPVVEVFKANDRLQAGLGEFCPWKALRSLGRPGEEKRAEFGLAESDGSLTIETSSGSYTFRLGGETYGPKDRYVADDETGKAFLVAGRIFREFERPGSRFMERSLHAFKMKEIARVRLHAGERDKELVRATSGETGEAGWADSRSPGDPKALYRNWIRRLSALRATGYVGLPGGGEGGGCAAPGGSSQELNLTFFSAGREIGFLRLYKGAGEKGDAAYYACSEHTGTVVTIPKTQAEALLEDLENVLSD